MLKNKSLFVIGLALMSVHSSYILADEVIGHSPDNTAGHLLGGWTMFLVGGAAAGPAGAIIGGFSGVWAGGEIQEASGHSGSLHHVKSDQGTVEILRSPKHFYGVGEQVVVSKGRLHATN